MDKKTYLSIILSIQKAIEKGHILREKALFLSAEK